MNSLLRTFFVCLCAAPLMACQVARATPQRLHDAGDPAAALVRQAFADLRSHHSARAVHVLQLGDSHTAADYFTGRLRDRLQTVYGAGASGWLPPMRPPAQRSALMRWQDSGWQLIESRNADAPDFPLGGYIATPTGSGAITYTLKHPTVAPVALQLLLKRTHANAPPPVLTDAQGASQSLALPADGQWHWVASTATMPASLHAEQAGQYSAGALWVAERAGGVILSAIGSNGAQQTLWQKWRANWMAADLGALAPAQLILIAYGTNEAFAGERFDALGMQRALDEGIGQLRAQFPQAVVLIVGAPDSLGRPGPASGAACKGRRPAALDAVQQVQRAAALRNRTLYWDWQAAMGGPCSMARWQASDLARPDGVHLNARGYEASADLLADDLLQWLSGR